jgi:hypothetical protein
LDLALRRRDLTAAEGQQLARQRGGASRGGFNLLHDLAARV